MADTEYTDAWKEGEDEHKDDKPAENAVTAAAKKVNSDSKDEYITAYTDLDAEKPEDKEEPKDDKPKSKGENKNENEKEEK